MYFTKLANSNFTEELEQNLNIQNKFESNEFQYKLALLMELLDKSATLLEEVGFNKQAFVITDLMGKFAGEDEATKGLTPEKMVDNLKEKGWVFNVDDAEHKNLDQFLQPKPKTTDIKPNEINHEIVVDDEAPPAEPLKNPWDQKFQK